MDDDHVRIETGDYIIKQSIHHTWTVVVRKKYPYMHYLFYHIDRKVYPNMSCLTYDIPYDPESKYWDYYSVINL